MTVSRLQLPAKDNAVQLKINEIIDNLGGGGATDVQINGTSITSNNIANILTESAYSANNKIATMSDLPASEIFIATYGTTTFNEVLTAYNAGKMLFAKNTYGYFARIISGGSTSFVFEILNSSSGTSTTIETPVMGLWTLTSTGWSSASTNLQRTTTAVTHTASTQVGDSTTPVYIASNGTATSTGLSIGSSRFDGQWTNKNSSLSTSTSKGSYTISLSSYLPSDNYKYEVLIQYKAYRSGSGDSIGSIKSDIVTDYMNIGIANSNARQAYNCFTIPVGTGRVLYYQISTNNLDSTNMYAIAYRRIGTNL